MRSRPSRDNRRRTCTDTAREIRYSKDVRNFTHVLFALIALQLAFGLQAATAAVAYSLAPSSHAHAMSDPCPVHKDAPKPADKHDCCKLSSNQCQCGTVGVAVDAMIPGAAPVLPFVSAPIPTRPACAPAESHFRPPIAS